jgi:ribonuclease HI
MFSVLADRNLRRAKLTHLRNLVTGRHNVTLRLVPTVTGLWAWTTTCHTCSITRRGADLTQTEALDAAHCLVGPRDRHFLSSRHHLPQHHDFAHQLTTAGHPALRHWDRLSRVTLPAGLTGDGYTVATDGTYNQFSNTAAWAFVTDAGWCASGPLSPVGVISSDSAEFHAVRHALKIYPTGSAVTLYIDNLKVGALIQDLAEQAKSGNKLNGNRLPVWAFPSHAGDIKARISELASVTVLWKRTNTDRLHRLADTLARAANGAKAKKASWRPVDMEPIGGTCEPTCTLIQRLTPTASAPHCA